MKKDNIKLIQKASDWEESIRMAGSLLVDSSSCTKDYVDEMVAAVNNLGPYIVIAPSIALAHARPSSFVKENDISLVVCKEPISFGHENNDPVSLVFSFCATANEGHLEQLGKLSDILSDEDTVKAIINSSTVDEVLNILTG